MPEFELPLFLYGLAVGLAAGLLGGLMAGLAGVGGGLIYVPVFYALMPANNDNIDSMGTYIFASFIAIIITGFFSTRSHWRLGHVDQATLYRLLPGLIVGAGIGLWSTLHIPGSWVLLTLAALNAWVAFDYNRTLQVHTAHQQQLQILYSGPIGFLSGALGIGGGTMLVPLLRRYLILRQAVGTSACCGLIMTLAACVINLSMESRWYGMLMLQWVFLLSAWLGIMLILPRSIHWAARLHEHMAESTLHLILKSIFGALSISLLIAAMSARIIHESL